MEHETCRFRERHISPNYASDQTLFIGTKFHGVWKTTDGGSSWAQVNNGLTILDVRTLTIAPNDLTNGTLFAWTARAAFSRRSMAAAVGQK